MSDHIPAEDEAGADKKDPKPVPDEVFSEQPVAPSKPKRKKKLKTPLKLMRRGSTSQIPTSPSGKPQLLGSC